MTITAHPSKRAITIDLLAVMMPRAVGLFVTVAALSKSADTSNLEQVLRFDGFPMWSILPLVWLIVCGEIVLGQALLFAWGGRRTLWIAIGVFAVYAIQVAFLAASESAPNCGCLNLLQQFESAHRANLHALVRNVIVLLALVFALLAMRSPPRSTPARSGVVTS